MKLFVTVLYLISIFISAAMAFVYRKEIKSRHLFILLPYLILVFIQETGLLIAGHLKLIDSTSVFYNIHRPISVCVFAFIYYSIPFMAPLKRLIAGLTVLYLIATIVNFCFIESILKNSVYMTLARGFIITLFAVLFLFKYFSLDNLKDETYWRPLVWITAGIAIFYPVVTTSLSFQPYLFEKNATILGFKLYQMIPQVMSIFMYSCFSYAFYLCQKIK